MDSTVLVQHSPEEAGRGQLMSLVGGEAQQKVSPDGGSEGTISPSAKRGKLRGECMSFLTRTALKANFLNLNNGTKCQLAHPRSRSLSLELSTHVLP